MCTERELLFGVLALQDHLIDDGQLAEACESWWSTGPDRSLADHLVERGWLSATDRAVVEWRLERKLNRIGTAPDRLLWDLADGPTRLILADYLGEATPITPEGSPDPGGHPSRSTERDD